MQTLDGSQWTPMPPLEGTIVVNIGDLLQFWSGGQFRATPHRVIVDQQTFNQSRLGIQIRNSKTDLNIVALSIGCRNKH